MTVTVKRDSHRGVRRRSFTLVEMLITITILALVATIVYGAMQMAQRSAREAKTKATIAKLHRIIMTKWESYRTRRLPIDPPAYAAANTKYYPSYANGALSNKDMARLKLNALRDLMRVELPDRWSDVGLTQGTSPCLVLPGWPALSQRYQAKLFGSPQASTLANASSNGPLPAIFQYASAKCLYMIVMSSPDDATQFQADEYTDYSGDGLPVFIDGWGRPIQFLRWPVGFTVNCPPRLSGSTFYPADSNLQSGNWTKDANGNYVPSSPDPFDPMKANLQMESQVLGYNVYPLIYSCGPNPQRDSSGQFRSDINVGKQGSGSSATFSYALTANGNLDIYGFDGTGQYLVGQPLSPDGTSAPQHYQNIHNHRLEVR